MRFKSKPEAYSYVLYELFRLREKYENRQEINNCIESITNCFDNHEQDVSVVANFLENLCVTFKLNQRDENLVTQIKNAVLNSVFEQTATEKFENPLGRRAESELPILLLQNPTKNMMNSVKMLSAEILNTLTSMEQDSTIDTFLNTLTENYSPIALGAFKTKPTLEQVKNILSSNNSNQLPEIMHIHFKFAQGVFRDRPLTPTYLSRNKRKPVGKLNEIIKDKLKWEDNTEDFFGPTGIGGTSEKARESRAFIADNLFCKSDLYTKERNRGREGDFDSNRYNQLGLMLTTQNEYAVNLPNHLSSWGPDCKCQTANFKSGYVLDLIDNDAVYIAGPSGMTSLFLAQMEVLGNFQSIEAKQCYLTAVASYIVGGGLHSLHEVIGPAQYILDLVPGYAIKPPSLTVRNSPPQYSVFYEQQKKIDPEFAAIHSKAQSNYLTFFANTYAPKNIPEVRLVSLVQTLTASSAENDSFWKSFKVFGLPSEIIKLRELSMETYINGNQFADLNIFITNIDTSSIKNKFLKNFYSNLKSIFSNPENTIKCDFIINAIQEDIKKEKSAIKKNKKQIVKRSIPEKVDINDLQDGKLISNEIYEEIKNKIISKEILLKGNKISKKTLNEMGIKSSFSVLFTGGKLYAIYKGKKHKKLLGQGAFSKVKILQDLKTGEFFAGKYQSSKHAHKISREVQFLRKVGQIDNVVAYPSKSPEFQGEANVLIMKMTPGSSLENFVSGRNKTKNLIRMPEKMNIIKAMAVALADVHHLNILHLDIGCHNIYYDDTTKKAQLIDFGESIQLADNQQSTHDVFRGTPIYAPPEVKEQFLKMEEKKAIWNQIKLNYCKQHNLNPNSKEINYNLTGGKEVLEQRNILTKEIQALYQDRSCTFSKKNDVFSMGIAMMEVMGWAQLKWNHLTGYEMVLNKPILLTNTTINLYKLFSSMIDPNPDHRPDIQDVIESIKKIQQSLPLEIENIKSSKLIHKQLNANIILDNNFKPFTQKLIDKNLVLTILKELMDNGMSSEVIENYFLKKLDNTLNREFDFLKSAKEIKASLNSFMLEKRHQFNIPEKIDMQHIDIKNGKLISDNLIDMIRKKIASGDIVVSNGKISKKILHGLGINVNASILIQTDRESNDNKYHLYAVYKGKKHGKELGAGASGVVKLVQNLNSGEFLAAKIQSCRGESINEIKNETDILKTMGQLKGEFTYVPGSETKRKKYGDNAHIMLIKLMPGKTLFNLISNMTKQNRTLPMHVLLEMLISITQAVSDMHNNNVIHNDIKFDNIMFDSRTKKTNIIDFGGAIHLQNNNSGKIIDTKSQFLPKEIDFYFSSFEKQQIIINQEYIKFKQKHNIIDFPGSINDLAQHENFLDNSEIQILAKRQDQLNTNIEVCKMDFSVKNDIKDLAELMQAILTLQPTNLNAEESNCIKQLSTLFSQMKNRNQNMRPSIQEVNEKINIISQDYKESVANATKVTSKIWDNYKSSNIK